MSKRLNDAVGKCQQCGKDYVRTSDSYVSCPEGHGRLISQWSFRSPSVIQKHLETMADKFERLYIKYLKVCRKLNC